MLRVLCAAGATLALLPAIALSHVHAGGLLLRGGTAASGPGLLLLAGLGGLLIWLTTTALLIRLAEAAPSVAGLHQPARARSCRSGRIGPDIRR